MAVKLDQFNEPTLPAATSDEAYELHRAALEWQLATPIAIRSGKDILSRDRWRDRVQPFHHQVRNLITFCRLAPAVLLADEVGLGKTVSAGLILSELIARRRVGRALVVCPRVLCDQWVQELADKFRIDATVATGAEWSRACLGAYQVVVTTYETAGRYFDVQDLTEDVFQMLILDEAHRLRNLHGPNGPPQFATTIRNALDSRVFNYVLMLTATPIQNRFTDVYSLIDLLTLAKGHRNPFGDWTAFRSQYLLPGTDARRLRPNMADRFRQILNGYVARTRRVDAALPFPNRHVETIRVPLTPSEREFEGIVGGIVGELNALTQSSLGESLMSSPAALAAQLERMGDKHPQLRAPAVRARAVAEGSIPPAKLARLYTLCDELRASRPDWRVVVFTRRRETQEMIRRGLTARGVPVGMIAGGRPEENRRDTASFLASPPRVHVLVSTDAGAEGVNLQGANWLVNYDLPWNPMILEQRIGRVQRLGSLHREVFIQNFVATGTVEELVVARLMQRLMAVTETVGDLESILEATGSEDDAGEGFATRVRELVVQSLRGQDATWAAEQLAASLERAKQEYDSNCGQMNRDLGTLDGAGSPAPPPPSFERRTPSIPADEFARRALAVENKAVREVRPGLLEVTRDLLLTERYALTPQVVESPSIPSHVIPCYPGQRAFEQLVERWASRNCHRVLDYRTATDSEAERLARDWCDGFPEATFVSCKVRDNAPHIHGQVLVRMIAGNRIDQHDQLAEYIVAPEGHRPSANGSVIAPILRNEVSLKHVAPQATLRVQREVSADKEVNDFVSYYLARRTNELSRAGANPHLRQRIEDDLTVGLSAEVVGFRGTCYDRVNIDIMFTVDGCEYSTTLQAVPVFGQVLEQPRTEQCPVTGLRMPFGVLSSCDRSGRLVPEHRLYRSVISGRQAAQEFVVRCEITNRAVLDDEVEICEVTGRRALSAEFITCAVTAARILRSESGTSAVSQVVVRRDLLLASERSPYRLGIADEMVKCEVTGLMLLRDEVGRSAVSGRIADLDRMVRSEIPPHRFGLPDEIAHCDLTECVMLIDEAGVCEVSGKRVTACLLVKSDLSGKLALKEYCGRCTVTGKVAFHDELERCHLTGELVLPDQLETCVVSHQRIIRREMFRCEITGAWLSPISAARSDVSGRVAHPDQIRRSERPPQRAGLPDEIGVCEFSGRILLLDELNRSAVSGRLADRDVLEQVNGRFTHPTEVAQCMRTGQRLPLDETEVCSHTGKRVARDQLVRSAVSGLMLLPEHAMTCSVTGKLASPDELETCAFSGAKAIPSEMETCAATGLRVLRSRLTTCTESGRLVVSTELAYSDYSFRPVMKSLLHQSQKSPGRLGTGREFGRCDETGHYLLLDELERCGATGKFVDRDLLVACGESGSHVLKSETKRCAWRRTHVLTQYMGVCELTRLNICSRFLDDNGMLIPLGLMLDGRYPGNVKDRSDLIPLFREIDANLFDHITTVDVVASPGSRHRLAVCVAITKRGWFSTQRLHAGFVVDIHEQPRIIGHGVIGARNKDREWEMHRSLTTS